jgi:hypothetical protein
MGSDHDLLAKNVGFFNAGGEKSANDGLSGGARLGEASDLAMDIDLLEGANELP